MEKQLGYRKGLTKKSLVLRKQPSRPSHSRIPVQILSFSWSSIPQT